MDTTDEGFVQDYTPGLRQDLFIYCRLCRSTFPVSFKPRPQVRLRCLCGHEAALAGLDVFRSEAAAREHAALYERLVRAAKDALREAGVPIPPSGKFRALGDPADPTTVVSTDLPSEDASDIANSYQEPKDESDETAPPSVARRLAEFDAQVAAADAPLERHDALTDLIEWTWCRRHLTPELRARLRAACRADIDLAEDAIADAKRRMREGAKVRLSFLSFKHLALDLEEEDDLAGALEVVERARALGLKGYDERAAELRAQLEGDP